MPSALAAEPVSLSGAARQHLDSLLGNTFIATPPLAPFVSQEIELLRHQEPTLPAGVRHQVDGLVAQLHDLLGRPSVDGHYLVNLVSHFVDFLKAQPRLEHQLDLLLRGIPVQTNFFIPFVSAVSGAANGGDPSSAGGIAGQEHAVASQPFISARFLVFLIQEAANDFVDNRPVVISLSAVSSALPAAEQARTFRLVAPETGQLLVQVDMAAGGAPGDGDPGATLSVFDGTGRLLDATATAGTGVGVVGLDVQEGQSYSVLLTGSGTGAGRYDLLFALAFGEPSSGTPSPPAGSLADVLAAVGPRPPAVGLLSLGDSSFALVATLLSPGAGGPSAADAPAAAPRGQPSLPSESREATPAVESGGESAGLVAGLEEALAGRRPATAESRPDGDTSRPGVDQQPVGDGRATDAARPAKQVGGGAVREPGPPLPPPAKPSPAPGPGRPAGFDRLLPEPGWSKDEPAPDEPDGEPALRWEASLAAPLFLLAACQPPCWQVRASDMTAGSGSSRPTWRVGDASQKRR